MRKSLFLVVAVLLFAAVPAAVAEQGQYYFGAGASYVWEDIEVTPQAEALGVDWSNAYGVNVRGGYWVNNGFAAEIDFDYVTGFEADAAGIYQGFWATASEEATVTAISVVGRVVPMTQNEKIKPYVLCGLGYAMSDESVDTSVTGFGLVVTGSKNEEEEDFFYKIGAGIQLFPERDWSPFAEAYYWQGFNEFDNVKLYVATAGIVLNF